MADIKLKLDEFRGPISTVDEETSRKLGKILINLEDESCEPEKETY